MYQVDSYKQLKQILQENSDSGGDKLVNEYIQMYDRLLKTLS